ncbi:MAG TPA: Hsp20/alpha crystallin family protein [Dehalococcoidia bacterium]
MTSLILSEPMREMEEMRREMNRLLEGMWPFRPFNGFAEYGYIPVDIRERNDAFELTASLPGVRPEDVDVRVQGNTVTITAEIRGEQEGRDEGWLRRERRYGKFARSLTLPAELDANHAEASLRHGVLTVHLPKAEAAKARTIKVRAA